MPLTTLPLSGAECLGILKASTSWSPNSLSRPVIEQLYLELVYIPAVILNTSIHLWQRQVLTCGCKLQRNRLCSLLPSHIASFSYNKINSPAGWHHGCLTSLADILVVWCSDSLESNAHTSLRHSTTVGKQNNLITCKRPAPQPQITRHNSNSWIPPHSKKRRPWCTSWSTHYLHAQVTSRMLNKDFRPVVSHLMENIRHLEPHNTVSVCFQCGLSSNSPTYRETRCLWTAGIHAWKKRAASVKSSSN